MRKFLLPTHLLFAFIAVACLCLSVSGLSYFTLIIYVPLMVILLLDVILTLYDLVTRRQHVLENNLYNGLHIGFYFYITLVYIRLFFDYGMLYINGNLAMRFVFVDYQLIFFLIGAIALVIYHICSEFNESIPTTKKRKRNHKANKIK